VSQKNIPNIFDTNLKTNYQILIIFGTNIPDITCHQMAIQFPPYPTFVSALPGENTTSKASQAEIRIVQLQYFCTHHLITKLWRLRSCTVTPRQRISFQLVDEMSNI